MAGWLKQQGHTSYFIDYDEQAGIAAGIDWAQRFCKFVPARRPFLIAGPA
jgi:hypothetical protein